MKLIHYFTPLWKQNLHRFRKRWPEPNYPNIISCRRCGRNFSARNTNEKRRNTGSGARRNTNSLSGRIEIERLGSNGSRLILRDYNGQKDSGVYCCFAQRIRSSLPDYGCRSVTGCGYDDHPTSGGKFEAVYVEAEVKYSSQDWTNGIEK
jgi:hypothetical protein